MAFIKVDWAHLWVVVVEVGRKDRIAEEIKKERMEPILVFFICIRTFCADKKSVLRIANELTTERGRKISTGTYADSFSL